MYVLYCTVRMYVADTVSPSSSAGHPLKGKHRKSASMSALNYPALLPKSSEQVHIGKEGPNTNSGTDILSVLLKTYIHKCIHTHILFTYKNIYINNKKVHTVHTYIEYDFLYIVVHTYIKCDLLHIQYIHTYIHTYIQTYIP